jgi:hypothetical protein
MFVYIASPYTIGDKLENVQRQIEVASALIDRGHTPYPPLLSHYIDNVKKRKYEEWMKIDLRWLKKCDCLLRLSGKSEGADREVATAICLKIPVFTDIYNIPKY